MTGKEKHADIVKTNLSLCGEVVIRAEIANKGNRSHAINSALGRLKPKLTSLRRRKPENISMEDLKEVCKLRMTICDNLYLASEKL